ncbi:MAG: hypothetical protein AAF378_23550, partial [Cyanobacteria bacterium P01_A01_bin.84]
FTFRSEELNKGYEYGEDINLLHSLHQNSQEAVKCIDRWNKFRLDRYTESGKFPDRVEKVRKRLSKPAQVHYDIEPPQKGIKGTPIQI